MWKAALAGAMLATMGATVVVAEDYATAALEPAQGGAVTEGHIARLKSALKLKPHQQQYWPAVESALRNLNRRSQAASDGLVRRAAAVVIDANDLRRLSAVAGPLIGSLDDAQKENGLRVVRSMGFGHLASAF
jgi:hypothetical protein